MSLNFAHTYHVNWTYETHALLRELSVKPGQSVFDAGCGFGFLTLDLARLVGDSGRIFARDAGKEETTFLKNQLQLFGLENVEVSCGPIEETSEKLDEFDSVVLRFVASALSHPEAVFKTLARSLKPGGKIGIFDYFASKPQLYPENKRFADHVDEQVVDSQKTYENHSILQSLPSLLEKMGFRDIRIQPIVNLGLKGDRNWSSIEAFESQSSEKIDSNSILLSPIYCQMVAELR